MSIRFEPFTEWKRKTRKYPKEMYSEMKQAIENTIYCLFMTIMLFYPLYFIGYVIARKVVKR